MSDISEECLYKAFVCLEQILRNGDPLLSSSFFPAEPEVGSQEWSCLTSILHQLGSLQADTIQMVQPSTLYITPPISPSEPSLNSQIWSVENNKASLPVSTPVPRRRHSRKIENCVHLKNQFAWVLAVPTWMAKSSVSNGVNIEGVMRGLCTRGTSLTNVGSRDANLNHSLVPTNFRSHLKKAQGTKSALHKYQYVATQDWKSPYYNPDWVGQLSEDGFPIDVLYDRE